MIGRRPARIDIARAIRYFADAVEDVRFAHRRPVRTLLNPVPTVGSRDLRLMVVMAERGLEDATASSLFHCQHICEKAMKACLCLVGIFAAEEHNVALLFANHVLPLVNEQEREQFTALMPEIRGIEWFYIPSRYGVDRYGVTKADRPDM